MNQKFETDCCGQLLDYKDVAECWQIGAFGNLQYVTYYCPDKCPGTES